MIHTVTINIDVPDGYAPTGEVRHLNPGERGCNAHDRFLHWQGPQETRDSYFVVRRKEPTSILACREMIRRHPPYAECDPESPLGLARKAVAEWEAEKP